MTAVKPRNRAAAATPAQAATTPAQAAATPAQAATPQAQAAATPAQAATPQAQAAAIPAQAAKPGCGQMSPPATLVPLVVNHHRPTALGRDLTAPIRSLGGSHTSPPATTDHKGRRAVGLASTPAKSDYKRTPNRPISSTPATDDYKGARFRSMSWPAATADPNEWPARAKAASSPARSHEVVVAAIALLPASPVSGANGGHER